MTGSMFVFKLIRLDLLENVLGPRFHRLIFGFQKFLEQRLLLSYFVEKDDFVHDVAKGEQDLLQAVCLLVIFVELDP